MVQAAFGTVLWIVCGAAIVIAVVTLAMNGRVWEDYGRRGLLMEREGHRPQPATGAAAQRERDEEIRQMLEARNARRARRGEPPVDVEAELARLTAPAVDAGLRDEVRQLVIARNHRLSRRGEAPLDVEAEVEREIAGLRDL